MGTTLFKERSFIALMIITYYGGYTMAVNAAVAPYLAADFGLSAIQVATMFGWLAFGLLWG